MGKCIQPNVRMVVSVEHEVLTMVIFKIEHTGGGERALSCNECGACEHGA